MVASGPRVPCSPRPTSTTTTAPACSAPAPSSSPGLSMSKVTVRSARTAPPSPTAPVSASTPLGRSTATHGRARPGMRPRGPLRARAARRRPPTPTMPSRRRRSAGRRSGRARPQRAERRARCAVLVRLAVAGPHDGHRGAPRGEQRAGPQRVGAVVAAAGEHGHAARRRPGPAARRTWAAAPATRGRSALPRRRRRRRPRPPPAPARQERDAVVTPTPRPRRRSRCRRHATATGARSIPCAGSRRGDAPRTARRGTAVDRRPTHLHIGHPARRTGTPRALATASLAAKRAASCSTEPRRSPSVNSRAASRGALQHPTKRAMSQTSTPMPTISRRQAQLAAWVFQPHAQLHRAPGSARRRPSTMCPRISVTWNHSRLRASGLAAPRLHADANGALLHAVGGAADDLGAMLYDVVAHGPGDVSRDGTRQRVAGRPQRRTRRQRERAATRR